MASTTDVETDSLPESPAPTPAKPKRTPKPKSKATGKAKAKAEPAPKAATKPKTAKTPPAPPADRKAVNRVANLLKMVSDPTRLQIILLLADGEWHVGAICDQVGMSQPAVSHHLSLCRHSGVIEPRRVGQQNFYTLTDKGETLARVVKAIV